MFHDSFYNSVIIFFSAGCFYSIVIYIVRQILVQIQNKKQNFLPLWRSWVIAAFLRTSGLILGYILITWHVQKSDISSQEVTFIVFSYTIPIFFGLFVDLLKIIRL